MNRAVVEQHLKAHQNTEVMVTLKNSEEWAKLWNDRVHYAFFEDFIKDIQRNAINAALETAAKEGKSHHSVYAMINGKKDVVMSAVTPESITSLIHHESLKVESPNA